jgi:hemolysin activation/secretion protein
MGLLVKIDGQTADQPLIDNEQYTGGGMDSVRGYAESEASGDNAAHGTVEISFPGPFESFGFGKWFQLTPYVFYDAVELSSLEPLPGTNRSTALEGAGAGIRGSLAKNLEYEVDWAKPLRPNDRAKRTDERVYFKVKAVF